MDRVHLSYNFLLQNKEFESFVKEQKEKDYQASLGLGNSIRALCTKTIFAKWGKSDTDFTKGKEYNFRNYSKQENCKYFSYSTSDNECIGHYYIDFFNEHFKILEN